jgi:hypothetical protein
MGAHGERPLQIDLGDVEVAAKYVAAGIEFFEATEISGRERETFLKAVPDADLTSPLIVV